MHQKNGQGELARSVITNLKYSYHLEMTKSCHRHFKFTVNRAEMNDSTVIADVKLSKTRANNQFYCK